MSLIRRRTRAPLALLLAVAGAATASAPAEASPYGVQDTFTDEYSCQLPGIGAQPTTLSGTSLAWQGEYTGYEPRLDASFTATPARLLEAAEAAGATTVAITGSWQWRATAPDGSSYEVTRTFDAGTQSVSTGSGAISGSVAGPGRTIEQAGTHTFTLVGLSFVLRATDAAGAPVDLSGGTESDGDPTSSAVPCTGSPLDIAGIVYSQAPLTPVITRVETTTTSASLFLDPARYSSNWRYEVYEGGVRVGPPEQRFGNPLVISDLTPGSKHTYTVLAFAPFLLTPSRSQPVTVTLPSASQTVGLSGSGSIALRGSLVGRGSLSAAISGELRAGGEFSGEATFQTAFVAATVLGFLPVKATLGFTPVGQTTGQASAGAPILVETTQNVAIRSATFFGLPIGTGTCHTAVPATIALRSTSSGGSFQSGGVLEGAFDLGRLTGCSTFGSFFGTNGGKATVRLVLAPPTA